MRGILYSNYKLVEEALKKLEEEGLTIPNDDEVILHHKKRLSEIYKSYKGAFEEISLIVKEFDEHKKSIKRLVILQKRKKG